MEGFAFLVGPDGWRERRRWFPLAGRLPEGLLGQAGPYVPWRPLAELPPVGQVVGLPLTQEGFARWDPAKRRQHLRRLFERLGEQGVRLVGWGRGLPAGPEGSAPVREAAREVLGGEEPVVEPWVGRLAGGLAAVELAAATRRWDCERVETVVAGAETARGRVAARLLGRRFGRLTLLGDSPALERLARQILHETGTAARTTGYVSRALARASLLILAAPLPEGSFWPPADPGALVVDLGPGSQLGRQNSGSPPVQVISTALFAWPTGPPSAALPGLVWSGGDPESLPSPLVSGELAAVAALAALREARELAGSPDPTVGGVSAARRAMAEAGLQATALLDKAGTVLL